MSKYSKFPFLPYNLPARHDSRRACRARPPKTYPPATPERSDVGRGNLLWIAFFIDFCYIVWNENTVWHIALHTNWAFRASYSSDIVAEDRSGGGWSIRRRRLQFRFSYAKRIWKNIISFNHSDRNAFCDIRFSSLHYLTQFSPVIWSPYKDWLNYFH